MAERIAIPKSVRFEVFKRDAFTCQYCGAKAPDVVLNCDHIKPVAEGGDNDMMNLITACFGCNSGKGATLLSDKAAVERQRAQLDELNERRLQIEMMLEWRGGLDELNRTAAKAVSDRLFALVKHTLNEIGLGEAKRLLKKYGLDEVLTALETSVDVYVKREAGVPTNESVAKAWTMLPRVINMSRVMKDKPYMRELMYIRGILRKRLPYVNEMDCIKIMEGAVHAGADVESIKDLAKSCRSWTGFRDALYEFMAENKDD